MGGKRGLLRLATLVDVWTVSWIFRSRSLITLLLLLLLLGERIGYMLTSHVWTVCIWWGVCALVHTLAAFRSAADWSGTTSPVGVTTVRSCAVWCCHTTLTIQALGTFRARRQQPWARFHPYSLAFLILWSYMLFVLLLFPLLQKRNVRHKAVGGHNAEFLD